MSSRICHRFGRVLICCLSSCLYYSSPAVGGGCYSFRSCNCRYPRNTFNNTQNADPQSHPQPDRRQLRTHFQTVPDWNSAYLATTALQRTVGLNTSGEERLKWQQDPFGSRRPGFEPPLPQNPERPVTGGSAGFSPLPATGQKPALTTYLTTVGKISYPGVAYRLGTCFGSKVRLVRLQSLGPN